MDGPVNVVNGGVVPAIENRRENDSPSEDPWDTLPPHKEVGSHGRDPTGSRRSSVWRERNALAPPPRSWRGARAQQC